MAEEKVNKAMGYILEFMEGDDSAAEKIFQILDTDGNGKIDYQELKSFLSAKMETSNEAVSEIIEKIDKDKDGRIDIKEFTDFLKKKRDGSM